MGPGTVNTVPASLPRSSDCGCSDATSLNFYRHTAGGSGVFTAASLYEIYWPKLVLIAVNMAYDHWPLSNTSPADHTQTRAGRRSLINYPETAVSFINSIIGTRPKPRRSVTIIHVVRSKARKFDPAD